MHTLRSALVYPVTQGLDLDNPQTTMLRKSIIREKKFLRLVYEVWYKAIAAALPAGTGPVIEIGSGAGFLPTYIPGLITTEIFHCPDIQVVLDGQNLPFKDRSL